MNFSLEHVGRKIIIHNAEGANWVQVGKEYTIKLVLSKNVVSFQGILNNWSSVKDRSWFFVDEIEEELNEGDNVILNKDTTSLKKGSKTAIKGFIGDDKRKVILEGIIPGGWVDSSVLTKMIDTEKYRIKKGIELLKEFGPGFMQVLGLEHSAYHLLGRDLSQFKTTQDGNDLLVHTPLEGVVYLTRSMYTDSAYEPLEMYIQNEKIIKSTNQSYEGPEISLIANKNYREIKAKFDPDNEKSVATFCQEYCRKGYIRIGQLILSADTFKIIKKETNETVQLPALPF